MTRATVQAILRRFRGVETGMQYGFVIDQRKCIGCHACTVACKAENEVPLGSFRTWVKAVDKGVFPETRRHFTVLRCNHCDQAPCVEICPVTALHKRPDAIVDLDRDLCIGCRACMQACPYDALYLNEDRGVVEKCHFCAHRTERGMLPACVIVCPEEAIVAGDPGDPESPIAALIGGEKVSRRKVERGTEPRVWYVDALEEALLPGRAREAEAYIWSERAPHDRPPTLPDHPPDPHLTVTLDAPHKPAWGWHIWAYMLTKNIAAGAALTAPFLAPAGLEAGFLRDLLPEVVALVFLALTGALLVHDLARPDRFLLLITRGNPSSWLVKGTWVLGLFGLLLAAGPLLRAIGAPAAAEAARWLNLPVALVASGYTAFLFKQCAGRRLWMQRGFFTALLLRAAGLGAGLGLLLAAVQGVERDGFVFTFQVLLMANVGMMIFEIARGLRDEEAARAHAVFKTDPGALVGILLLMAVPLLLSLRGDGVGLPVWAAGASLLGLALGILLFERAFVKAGQAVPIS